jgi:hypothetical protein
LEIVSIYPPYIYSVRYDRWDENEFDRLFQLWNDVGAVAQFIRDNSHWLKTPFWLDKIEPEDATRQVLDEAESLETLFDVLNENTSKGQKPDFDSHFQYLDGKYKFVLEWQPMKSYGTSRPSLLRIYAIKMAANTYLITGGGIKLADTIQNSPDLKDHIIQDIDVVRTYLKENGIMDSDDMENDF